MRQRAGGAIQNDATMVEDFLKFACRRAALASGQVGVTPRVHGVGADSDRVLEDRSKLQGRLKDLQPIQGPSRIVFRKFRPRFDGGKPIVINKRIEGKSLFEITLQLSRSGLVTAPGV